MPCTAGGAASAILATGLEASLRRTVVKKNRCWKGVGGGREAGVAKAKANPESWTTRRMPRDVDLASALCLASPGLKIATSAPLVAEIELRVPKSVGKFRRCPGPKSFNIPWAQAHIIPSHHLSHVHPFGDDFVPMIPQP